MLLNEYPEIKNVIRDSGYSIVSVIEDTIIGFLGLSSVKSLHRSNKAKSL